MIKIFIDTSIILAASKSKNGGSSYVLMLCRQEKIQGFISRYVIYEAKTKSASLLTQQEKKRLNFLLLQCHLTIVTEPSNNEINKYIEVIEKKDAPILATAKSVDAHYLLTLNTRDFMQEKVRKLAKPMQLATPKNFIKNRRDCP